MSNVSNNTKEYSIVLDDICELYIYTSICEGLFYDDEDEGEDGDEEERFKKFMHLEGTKSEDGSFAVKVTLKGSEKLIEKINDKFDTSEQWGWKRSLDKILEWGI